MQRFYFKHYFFIFMIIIMITALSETAECKTVENDKHILFISGYNPDYPSVNAWIDGIKEQFNKDDTYNFTYSYSYFDLIHFASQDDYLPEMARHLAAKFKNAPPDLIICDSFMLPFLQTYSQKIFPNVPIAAIQVNDPIPINRQLFDNLTIISSDNDDKEKIIQLILTTRPNTQKIFIIVNDSPLGHSAIKSILANKDKYPNIQFVFSNKMDYEEIYNNINTFKNDTAILYLFWNRYDDNKKLLPLQIFQKIYHSAKVPIYTINSYYIGKGATGGYIHNWKQVGQYAAKACIDILAKKKLSPVINTPNCVNQYIFDWHELTRWGINENLLPENTQIENKPPSLWTHYKNWIIYGSIVILLETSLTIFLFITYRKRKKAENKVTQLNINLEKIIRERTSELEKTIAELTSTKILQENTNNYLTTLNKKLHEISITDELTGLNNRRYTAKKIKEMIQKFKISGEIWSLGMADIDFFKKVNDKYGHDAGDFILIEVSKIMKKNLSGVDIVSRWGGEEFILLMPKTNLEQAKNKLENIRQLIDKKIWIHNDNVLHVTITLGVSTIHIDDAVEEDIIKRADLALYNGKNSGRNVTITEQ